MDKKTLEENIEEFNKALMEQTVQFGTAKVLSSLIECRNDLYSEVAVKLGLGMSTEKDHDKARLLDKVIISYQEFIADLDQNPKSCDSELESEGL